MAGSLWLALSNELDELTSSQYAPFTHKIALFSFFWMPTSGGETPIMMGRLLDVS